jgi:hypothetical protein
MASDPTSIPTAKSAEELAKLTPQELQQMVAASKVIEGPVANASSIFVSVAGNDAVLIFNRPRPMMAPDGTFANIALTETTAIIHVSMATLKDMSLALGDTIGTYEKQFGEIKTDYTRRRDAAKQ